MYEENKQLDFALTKSMTYVDIADIADIADVADIADIADTA